MDAVTDRAERQNEIWKDDRLNRRGDADFLQRYLTQQYEIRKKRGEPATFVLEVDERWGAGKTFFMQRFAQQLRLDGHIVAEVDAWADDHLDDPFTSIMAAIDEQIQPLLPKEKALAKAWATAKRSAPGVLVRAGAGALNQAVRKSIGMSIDELMEGSEPVADAAVKGAGPASRSSRTDTERMFDEIAKATEDGAREAVSKEIGAVIDAAGQRLIDIFRNGRRAATSFRKKLSSALASFSADESLDVKLPLFVLVDELDRCRPAYAIALLERVKHLFETDHVVFVFAMNSDQLQHTVRHAYGAGFEGRDYLKRFFHRTFNLSRPDPTGFIDTVLRHVDFGKVSFLNHDAFTLISILRAADLTPRELERLAVLLEGLIAQWPDDAHVDGMLLLHHAVRMVSPTASDLLMKHVATGHRVSSVGGSVDYSLSFKEAITRLEAPNPLADHHANAFESSIMDAHIRRLYDRSARPSVQRDILQLLKRAPLQSRDAT